MSASSLNCMYACPHCKAPTISSWRKGYATRIRPVRCSFCGGLSFVPGWHHALATVLSEVVIWGGIVVAVVVRNWYALVLIPLGLAAIFLLPGGALRATDASSVARARVEFAIELAVLAVIAAVAYVLFGQHAR